MKYDGMIVVWFSCGAASAVAAKKTIDRFGKTNPIRIVNNPVIEEDSDNTRFLKDVESWLGVPIEFAVNPAHAHCSAKEVWERRRFMSGPTGAPCTLELKKKAREHFEGTNQVDWHVLGFTADEKRRSDRFMLTERPNLIPVLVDAGITKAQCFEVLKEAGIRIPDIYGLGYPNANCIGCVKATSPTYWNHVRTMHPAVFDERAKQSREIGARLVRVKGKRLFLDQLDPEHKGRNMKNLDFECGIFCEEKF